MIGEAVLLTSRYFTEPGGDRLSHISLVKRSEQAGAQQPDKQVRGDLDEDEDQRHQMRSKTDVPEQLLRGLDAENCWLEPPSGVSSEDQPDRLFSKT